MVALSGTLFEKSGMISGGRNSAMELKAARLDSRLVDGLKKVGGTHRQLSCMV